MKQIITSLDVGTNSIKIIVGEIYRGELFVLACSEVKSEGIKKGFIEDEDKATLCIKKAFKRAEDVLGIKLDKVILIVPSYEAKFVKGEGYTTITRENKTIIGEDITRALQASVYNKINVNSELVSVSPAEFIINDQEFVSNPKGMVASKLSVNSVLGIIPKRNVYSIINILESLNVSVIDLAFGGQADYFEFRKKEYIDCQGAVINIGTNKTEVSVINGDILVGTEVIDVGGRNIDRDISYIYDLSLPDSKSLKEKFAFSHKDVASVSEIVECLTKTGENIKINQYEVSEIVYSRVKEILELSKKQINLLTKKAISYIIITGGTTEIEGFGKVYREVFGKNAQVTKVKNLGVRNNKYSSALGAIKLYADKLKFRDLIPSTISESAQEELFSEKKKIDGNSLLGKVYSYFFDN